MPTLETPRLVNTRNVLPETTRAVMIEVLQDVTYAQLDLRAKLKQAHWNVRGLQFIAIHELLDDLAAQMADMSDDTAERLTALGGYANGLASQVAQDSRLPKYPLNIHDIREHLSAIADQYGELGRIQREAIAKAANADDSVTEDLLIGQTNTVDQRLWFIEAHIQ